MIDHAFKDGVRGIINNHFAPSIAKNFLLAFEGEIFSKDHSKNIWLQMRDNNLILEVSYREGDHIEYITDLHSWQTKSQVESKLLRYVTDKVKAGVIGKNWTEVDGRISEEVRSGKHETK